MLRDCFNVQWAQQTTTTSNNEHFRHVNWIRCRTNKQSQNLIHIDWRSPHKLECVKACWLKSERIWTKRELKMNFVTFLSRLSTITSSRMFQLCHESSQFWRVTCLKIRPIPPELQAEIQWQSIFLLFKWNQLNRKSPQLPMQCLKCILQKQIFYLFLSNLWHFVGNKNKYLRLFMLSFINS